MPAANRSVCVIAFRPAGQTSRYKPSYPAVRSAPAAAGDSLLVSRFLPSREKSNSRIILHRTTSAKTRATATLRQLHIPPNVTTQLKISRKNWKY